MLLSWMDSIRRLGREGGFKGVPTAGVFDGVAVFDGRHFGERIRIMSNEHDFKILVLLLYWL
jgi:hypothetical protein